MFLESPSPVLVALAATAHGSDTTVGVLAGVFSFRSVEVVEETADFLSPSTPAGAPFLHLTPSACMQSLPLSQRGASLLYRFPRVSQPGIAGHLRYRH